MKCLIVKESAEIPLKSHRTRPRFERTLLNNIEYVLREEGLDKFKISIEGGVIFIEGVPEGLAPKVANVFGVHRVCLAIKEAFKDINDIASRAEEIFKDVVKGRKFAARVKRSGKHDFTSLDVAAAVGDRLKKYSAGVDLSDPEVTVNIEVRGPYAYYILKCWEGVKGLPVGVEGRVLVLFSGGYDSTLATWLAAKRGCEADFLHFFMGSRESTLAAFRVCKEVSKWLTPYKPRMTVIDFTPILADIKRYVRNDYAQVVLRYFMYYIAQKIARMQGYDAIVTGESVGQASSQTLRNLRSIEELLPQELRRPLIRPLAFYDKEEIIEKIRELGLYEICSKVREACRIAQGAVTTRAKSKVLSGEVSKIDQRLPDLVIKSSLTVGVLETDESMFSKLLESLIADVEIDRIPEDTNYVLVDARSEKEYREWHPEGAIHISKLLSDALLLSKDVMYIIYCDHGTVSYVYAKLLRQLGLNAYSLRGGVNILKQSHKSN